MSIAGNEMSCAELLSAAESHLKKGELEAGERALRSACIWTPSTPNGWYNLGVLERQRSAVGRAVSCLLRCLAVDPRHQQAGTNLGEALLATGEDGRASMWIEHFTLQAPGHPAAWHNAGLDRSRRGDTRGARSALMRAIALNPAYGGALSALGLICQNAAENDMAAVCYQRAIASGHSGGRNLINLGVIQQESGQLEAAAAMYRLALQQNPGNFDVRANLAAVSLDLGQVPQAKAEARMVLTFRPDHSRALWVSGWIQLLEGDFRRGYRAYDLAWRDALETLPAHARSYPLWHGGPVPGGRVLLWCEHGVGDEILYAGMLRDVMRTGVQAVVETDPRMVTLFQRSFPELEIIARCETIPADVVAQSSTARLPYLFRRRLADFTATGPYLIPDPERIDWAREVFSKLGAGALVGLAWRSGNRRTSSGKSTRLSDWQPLLARNDILPLSLQYDPGDESDERLYDNPALDIRDDIETLAAEIAVLDHVVSISGLTAHLAGALGRPGHVLLPRAPLWFWFAGGRRCPWYPSLSLVRQQTPGSWEREIAALTAEI